MFAVLRLLLFKTLLTFSCLNLVSVERRKESEGLGSETTNAKQGQNLVFRLVAEKKRACDERYQKFLAARWMVLKFDMV